MLETITDSIFLKEVSKNLRTTEFVNKPSIKKNLSTTLEQKTLQGFPASKR